MKDRNSTRLEHLERRVINQSIRRDPVHQHHPTRSFRQLRAGLSCEAVAGFPPDGGLYTPRLEVADDVRRRSVELHPVHVRRRQLADLCCRRDWPARLTVARRNHNQPARLQRINHALSSTNEQQSPAKIV